MSPVFRCSEGKAPIFGLRLIVQPRPPPASQDDPTLPYLHLDLAKTYLSRTKRDLAACLRRLYADVMQTQLWRPYVGIAELVRTTCFALAGKGWSRSRCSSCATQMRQKEPGRAAETLGRRR